MAPPIPRTRVLTSYYREKRGGLCKRLFRAINALLAEGHEVHYLAVAPFPIGHPRCYFHRFPWPPGHTENMVFWAFFHALAPWLLFYIGIRHRISHAFAFSPTYALVLQPLRFVKRIPLTLFLRADTLLNHKLRGRSLMLIKFEQLLETISLAGVRVYAVSHALRETIMARHPSILVGTAGVLPNDIPASYRKREQHASRPLRLACAGVLEARKNMSVAITAVAACDADAVKLEIYGSGPDEELLRKLVHDVGMTDRIVFRGWTDAEKIWSETDLLLFPSLHEGAPNAVLEALGHGVPVLASDTPEHRELLPRHALLPGNDPRAWGRRLQTICRDPAHSLATMVMDQQRRVGAFRFNWDEAVRRAILR